MSAAEPTGPYTCWTEDPLEIRDARGRYASIEQARAWCEEHGHAWLWCEPDWAEIAAQRAAGYTIWIPPSGSVCACCDASVIHTSDGGADEAYAAAKARLPLAISDDVLRMLRESAWPDT